MLVIRLAVLAVATLAVLLGAVVYPEYRWLYLLCGVIGLTATTRQYRRWSARGGGRGIPS